MQAIRALVIEDAAAPRFMGRLVGRARTTWPVLLGVPVLFLALLVQAVNGFAVPRTPLVYGDVVPQWMIYAVFIPAAAFALVAAAVGARRQWAAWGAGRRRDGTLLQGLAGIAADVLAHRRFGRCGQALPRKTGHLALFWGFAGALATTTLLGIAMDGFGVKTPLPQLNPIKLLGNVSAVLLVVGIAWLTWNRVGNPEAAGRSRAFDAFFLALVVVLVVSGVGAEVARVFGPPPLALGIYVVHLGMVLSLFLTFPYSKFAHALYRTLAMAHERLVSTERSST
jgi:quinone-modifying oxidoreductase subunit QmoC